MVDFCSSLKQAVSNSGPRPVITWLSDYGRIELSTITFANAVNKASNFLVEGLELDDQSSMNVVLGNHWQSPVWLGAALATGLRITEQEPDVTFGTNSQAESWQRSDESFVIVSKDPFGVPDKDADPRFINSSLEVRNFGDYFAPAWPVSTDHKVLSSSQNEFTWDELVKHSHQLAGLHNLDSGTSYGLQGTLDRVSSIAFQVVLPIVLGISVVLIEHSNVNLEDVKRQEKIEKIVTLY
jgi:uncharacterized protein (TIGR03089 family)